MKNPSKQEKSHKSYSRREFMKLAGLGLGVSTFGLPAIARPKPKGRSVVVLGIDGMDPGLLQNFIKKGMMPHAQRLIQSGSFSPLGTSNPPQSPVAWANFISGTNPGGHGIYDFIARDPETMTPYLSTSRVEGDSRSLRFGDWIIPIGQGEVVNLREGPTFWTALEKRGIDTTIVRIPANFPPSEPRPEPSLAWEHPISRADTGSFRISPTREARHPGMFQEDALSAFVFGTGLPTASSRAP